MRTNWPLVPLGDVINHRKEFFEISDDTRYQRCRVKLHAKGVEKRDSILGNEIKTKKQQACRPDDFLVAEIDAKVGGYGLVPDHLEDAIVSSHYFLFESQPEKILSKFLGYFARTQFFADQVTAKGSTNYAAIRPENVLSYQIPLPPLVEQKRIVTHLDAIETRLNRIQKLRAEADKLQDAILNAAFARMSEGASHESLSEISPIRKRAVEIDLDRPYKEFGIRSFYKGIFLRRTQRGSDYDWQKLFTVHEGDVVFSNIMAWEKAIGLASKGQHGWVGNHRMLVCEPNTEKVIPEWLFHYFKTSEGFAKLRAASPGSVARNKTLRASSLMEITVPVPSIAIQKQFLRIAELSSRSKALKTSKIENSEAVIPAILDRLFRK